MKYYRVKAEHVGHHFERSYVWREMPARSRGAAFAKAAREVREKFGWPRGWTIEVRRVK